MEAVSLREGVMASHFEMLSDWHWYLRRGGADRALRANIFADGHQCWRQQPRISQKNSGQNFRWAKLRYVGEQK
ncbi:MAG: hypothetical protein Ct9H90mP14_2800 [Methanobacteriota archaeon]|nr:MAG: hypothetical protein Ct9H90mP14_2800 [Euryarchaeota archaeon]